MPIETTHSGYLSLAVPQREMAEHGLHHAANREFFHAILDVIALLRAEALIRECHPIHDKLVALADFIHTEQCQDFTAEIYPKALD